MVYHTTASLTVSLALEESNKYLLHRHASPPSPTPLSAPILSHIKPILQRHPHRRANTHKHRPRQPLVPARRAEQKPLAPEMPHGDQVRQHGQLVHLGVSRVVGGVQAHDALEQGPGAEGAGVEGGRFGGVGVAGRGLDAVGAGREVDLRGEMEGAVGLEDVADGGDADLEGVVVS